MNTSAHHGHLLGRPIRPLTAPVSAEVLAPYRKPLLHLLLQLIYEAKHEGRPPPRLVSRPIHVFPYSVPYLLRITELPLITTPPLTACRRRANLTRRFTTNGSCKSGKRTPLHSK